MSTEGTTSGRKQGGRGHTKMMSLRELRASGRRIQLRLNEQGKIVGGESKTFSSYLGLCVRHHVPITIVHWKQVDQQVLANMWTDIQSMFEFDINVITYDKVMTRLSKLWRCFKSTTYNLYVFGKKKGEDPCTEYPFITPEMWQTFLKQRNEESAKILREENKEKADSNNYPHTMSRGGVDGLERRMMQEKLSSCIRELESQGKDSSSINMDQIPRPSRAEIWMEAKKKRSTGEYLTEESRLVGERIVDLTHQLSEGKFHEEGRKDVLAVALGKDEHPGRVRGVGQGVGIKAYFGNTLKPGPARGSGISQADMQMAVQSAVQSVVQSAVETAVQQAVVKTRKETMELMLSTMRSMGGPMQSVDNVEQILKQVATPTFPQKTVLQPSSNKASCGNDTTEDEDQPCALYIQDEERSRVAYGVVTASRILHGVNLSEDVVRVRVDRAIEKYAPLPCPVDDEIIQVRHALGTYVAWPRQLVDFTLGDVEGTSRSSRQSKAKKVQKSPSPDPEQDAGESLSNIRVLLSANATHPDHVYEIYMPEEVVGHSHQIFIHAKDIRDLLNKNQIDICWIQLWIMYVYELCGKLGQSSYGFASPYLINEHELQGNRVQHIVNRLILPNKRYIIIPIIEDHHWTLVVICPFKGRAFWYDSLGGSPSKDIKELFKSAYKEYFIWGGQRVDSKKVLQWQNCICPRQLGSWECGYYVMKYMLQIIREGFTDDTMVQAWCDCTPYSTDELDEVRETVAYHTLHFLQH